MSLIDEFKSFAFKGNVIDLAVGVIIGGAFGTIVNSFVEDVITPAALNPVLKTANLENISQLTWNGIKYGNFLSAVISFFIIAVVLFAVVKAANKFKKEKVEAPAGPSSTDALLMEIRDELRKK